MTQLPETAYAPFSEPWVLADVERPDKQQAEEEAASDSIGPSKINTNEQHSNDATSSNNIQSEDGRPAHLDLRPSKPVHEDKAETIVEMLGPEVQKYWVQTKGVVFGPEVEKYWIRIRGAVFPFVGGITGGLLGAALTVYKIRSS